MRSLWAGGLVWLMCALPATAASPASRAFWTWEAESYALVEDPAVAEEAIAYLKPRHVDTLYLYADAYQGRNLIVEQPQLYRAFIERMHAQGMKVYALLGSAYLNTENYVLPSHRAQAEAMFRRVVEYNAAHPGCMGRGHPRGPARRLPGHERCVDADQACAWRDLERGAGDTVLARWHRAGVEGQAPPGQRAHDRPV
jgi:hypothetical protein